MWSSIVLSMMAGAGAGCLGALLGLGGGIILVPFLHLVVGLPFWSASSISLLTVIATSVAVSAASSDSHPVNIRLVIVLQVLTVLGASTGVELLHLISERTAEITFGAVAAVIAVVMLLRLDRRNVTKEPIEVGALGGRFHDEESGGEVSYRLRRLPVAMGIAYTAGLISNLGVGGGILIVPALNTWCGVPIRAAAATSAFMIGVTAVPSIVGHYRLGHLTMPSLAAAAVLGVLAGSKVGLWLSPRVRVRSLKMLLAAILAGVAGLYFLR